MYTIKSRKDNKRNFETLARKDRKIENTVYTPLKTAYTTIKKGLDYISNVKGCKNISPLIFENVLDAFCGKLVLTKILYKMAWIFNITAFDKEDFTDCQYFKEIQKFIKEQEPEDEIKLSLNYYVNSYDEIKYQLSKKHYDLIISNPPFTPVDTFVNYFYDFIEMLSPDGYLLLFCPVYFLNNSDNRATEIFKNIEHIYFLPKMSFGRQQLNAFIIASKRNIDIEKRFYISF